MKFMWRYVSIFPLKTEYSSENMNDQFTSQDDFGNGDEEYGNGESDPYRSTSRDFDSSHPVHSRAPINSLVAEFARPGQTRTPNSSIPVNEDDTELLKTISVKMHHFIVIQSRMSSCYIN